MSEGESVNQESTEIGQTEGDTPEVAPEESIEKEGERVEEEGEEEAEEELSIDEQLATAKQEAAAHYDRYMRSVAELDNFRKRTARMRSEVREDTLRDMLLQMAPVVDNMRRALDQDTEDVEGLKQGIELIYSQFNAALEGYGLKAVEAMGEPFDPNMHEAMLEVEDAEHEPGTVVQEMEKGYELNGKVVRPARVVVSKAPSEGE
ncbi:MAG: nucleotide exchange factor GrpE [Candidatus Latescibacterota bacterium]|jgi:molecular chaperone GrpE|nr:nucleotide exchange factor GrpE [Candidatus Latescibacterota bacterium]MEC8647006.1 nucleotide exchange factor GrpE [Candidatus Latescibacterota bacterium]MEE2627601.1 nucleotide exchange factor GrpE [Candidatus Latescibacterota bacterium]MEE2728528.1 nucleotide exchange factor GrpE [Candidatus Latescibacterota bacterium]